MSGVAEQLSGVKGALLAVERMQAKLRSVQAGPIAVIGMSCRLPGARDKDEFWELLRNGRDAVTDVPIDRFDAATLYDPRPGIPGRICTKRMGSLEDVRAFDAAHFGISPLEAKSMDPQQRIVLEQSWSALEDAAIAPDQLRGRPVGVYIGLSALDYRIVNRTFDVYTGTGNAASVASGRVSYVLGLTGPSIVVDTACSSSLVALHIALQDLRTGATELALAGGVNLVLTPGITLAMSALGALSPAGRCNTFDAAASGYVRGEGCAIFVLKTLAAAQRDRDRILAVIHGSAANQDGHSSGLTVPSGPSQEQVIRSALRQAAIPPRDVAYVEAHGTGTLLGDPIELHALDAVMREDRPADHPLLIGSVKTNIGHLEAAAGAAGLAKLVLSLERGELPPHLHFQTPNPNVDWKELCVEVVTAGRPWPRPGRRIAGLSSFAFSGTNVHLVVASADEPEELAPEPEAAVHLMPVSGNSSASLARQAEALAKQVQGASGQRLLDQCFTAGVGRAGLKHRAAWVGRSRQAAAEALTSLAHGAAHTGLFQGTSAGQLSIAFLFAGQGSQRGGMGDGLVERFPVFRDAWQRCDAVVRDATGRSLSQLSSEHPDPRDTRVVQPRVFAFDYALHMLWKSWGVEPAAVMGHSLGEYVAACVSGVLGLEDALALVCHRAELMGSLPLTGAMAAILAPPERVEETIQHLDPQLSVAARNAPGEIVISGEVSQLDQTCRQLEAQGLSTKRLPVSHAFRSAQVDSILDAFEARVSKLPLQAPVIPLVSNVTGSLIGEEIRTPRYWRDQMRRTVQFEPGIRALLRAGCDFFLEIGPGATLTGLAAQCSPREQARLVFCPSLKGPDEAEGVLSAAATLWVHGGRIDWAGLYTDQGARRVALPTFRFDRSEYWLDSKPEVGEADGSSVHDVLGRALPALADRPLDRAWERPLDAGDEDAARRDAPHFDALHMASAVGHQLMPDRGLSLMPVRDLERPLADLGQRVQTVARRRGNDSYRVSFYVSGLGSNDWHLVADVALVGTGAVQTNDLEAELDRCLVPMPSVSSLDRLQPKWHSPGFELTLDAIMTNDRERVARFGTSFGAATSPFARLQDLTAGAVQLLFGQAEVDRGWASLLRTQGVRLIGTTPERGWLHLAATECPDRTKFDMQIIDHAGRLAASIEGLEFDRRNAAATQRSLDGRPLHVLPIEEARSAVESIALETFCDISGFAPADLDENAAVQDLGLDSMLVVKWGRALESKVRGPIAATAFMGHRTLRDIIRSVSLEWCRAEMRRRLRPAASGSRGDRAHALSEVK